MNKNNYLIPILCFFIVNIYPAVAQNKEINGPLGTGLFQLNEIDMHVHAGKERPVPLEEWIDMFLHDGRRVLLLLDHLELYRMTGIEYKEWIAKNKVKEWYPDSASARKDFMKDLASVESRKDILAFHGWEVWEGEIDEGIEKEPLRDAEVIGWHISKAAWDGRAPGGKELVMRARQIVAIQKEFPVPMIIFHPFGGRIKAIKETSKKEGRDQSSLISNEYRFFTAEDQQELIKVLAGRSVYIEIERGLSTYWDDLAVREALKEDIRPLTESGIKFTVSTDAHGTESFNTEYDPEEFCHEFGITAENVNSIVRELLAIRAKRDLKH
jgi:histidinol phosphatase-like PHP family hydrolase